MTEILEKEYDETIEIIVNDIALLDDDLKEQYENEWESFKTKLKLIEEKYKDNDFYKQKALDTLRKEYLQRISEYTEGDAEYEFYKVILELVGLDDYVLDSELEEVANKPKKR